MVNRCVAGGCSNTAGPGVSLHKFPSDPVLRKQWEKQVQRTRAKWKATETSVLCSAHFTEDCFEVTTALAAQFGLARKRKLVAGAIPTIFRTTAPEFTAAEPESSSSRKRPAGATPGTTVKKSKSAVEKRQRARVSSNAMRCNYSPEIPCII